MPYVYLEDVATADVAFKASGTTPSELFISAADATLNAMVEELSSVAAVEERAVAITDGSLELLLFQFLQELVYYKDAESLLLRAAEVEITVQEGIFHLRGKFTGEKIQPKKHRFNVDVKAVTWHMFQVIQNDLGWEATVVLDI